MSLRIVSAESITLAVQELFAVANKVLPEDAERLLENCRDNEKGSELAKNVLCTVCDNLKAAKENDLPICQDTGMAVVFAEIGCDVHIDGNFEDAVNKGVANAYLNEKFRLSVVDDPFFDRRNTNDNTPCVLHISFTHGDKIRLTVAPKGFGSENKSAIRMFTPSATREDIISFVLETVKAAGGDPCPPIMIGIGMGGTFDKSAVLAKKALTRSVSDENPDPRYAALEREILERVNGLGIGPQGFGGDTTALAVKIEQFPTHIAGLPVAVNINCHVMRHAECEI